MPAPLTPAEAVELVAEIKRWARELGFQAAAIAATELAADEARLLEWLAHGYHGEMGFMARHGTLRSRPAELEPGTLRVVSVRIDYWPRAAEAQAVLADPQAAYLSRYALGRDYHKLVRQRLKQLCERIRGLHPAAHCRPFVDSAPVLEKPLAAAAGLGWIGKHSNLLDRGGSWFFLGELYLDLPLPVDPPTAGHCGRCRACLDACPTAAFVAPYRLDARRCISYLTIEHPGPIPPELRPLLGNRIYGCDDCQLACPWNRFAAPTRETDFQPRHGLDAARLTELFRWREEEFLARLEGSPIRRIGHLRWLRNLAVALGNGPATPAAIDALHSRLGHPSELVREHVEWALKRLGTE